MLTTKNLRKMKFKTSELKQINAIIDKAFIDLKEISHKVKAFLEQGGEIRAKVQIKKIIREDENFSRAVFRFKVKTPNNLDALNEYCENAFLNPDNCRNCQLPMEESRKLFRTFNKLKPNTG